MTVRAGSRGSMTLCTVVVRGSHVCIMFNIAWLQSRMALITGLERSWDRIMSTTMTGCTGQGICNTVGYKTLRSGISTVVTGSAGTCPVS